MSRLARIASLLVLAACPKSQTGTGVAEPQGGAGCPSASGVLIASYVAQEPAKGRSGWVVPLHAVPLPAAEVPEYTPVDAATAAAAGVPAVPTGTLWLVSAAGQPCRATVGRYYAARIESSLSYGVEIEGCAAPRSADEGGGVVLVSDAAPSACRFEMPQPVAVRLGQMTTPTQWTAPTSATPIPPALAAAIPEHACAAPACETLWAFAHVEVNGQPVAWSGAVNWLTVGDPAKTCSWSAERFSGFFVPGPDGKAVQITEGQSHPLVLSSVLADGSGARVLLAEGPGEYATYDLVPGGAKLGRSVSWMSAPADAWEAVDHIGPICEPAR